MPETKTKKTATPQDKFLGLLRKDILKLDLADLDFGIYRILNYRRKEIDEFLTKRLPEKIAASLQGQTKDREGELQSRLDALTKQLNELATKAFGLESAFDGEKLRGQVGETVPGKEYTEKSEALARLKAESGMGDSEQERLYNTLYTFFSRYYEDGDFLVQPRRGKEARFSVDYGGEDVHFSWRGRGSHYIKTSEQLRSYAFKVESTDIRFEFVSADTEQDNVKGDQRYLVPLASPDIKDGQVTFYFEHRPLNADEEKLYTKSKGDIQDSLINDMLEVIIPKLEGVNIAKDDLSKHMRRYARKNTSDYFVHPNLGEFLSAELDYYLKNEYLNPDAITNVDAMTDKFIKFRALREIGNEVIAFLDQIEGFQARLFEKRRFVLDSSYLVQTRHLTDEQREQALKNDAQVQAWRDLFAIEGKIDKAFVDAHPTLVVDTKHFDKDFELDVLAQFEDLDEATDGLLIHAENYGALNTLQAKFEGKVKTIYIDPPYNTGGDGFLYKDDFNRHSTWLTMVEERIAIGKSLLSTGGLFTVSIDDNESTFLKICLDEIMGSENFESQIIIQSNKRGQTYKSIAKTHEYLYIYDCDNSTVLNELPKDVNSKLSDDLGSYELWELRNRNPKFGRFNRPNLFYPIYVDETAIDGEGYAPISLTESSDFNCEIYPRNSEGQDSCWRWGKPKVEQALSGTEKQILLAKQKRDGDWNIYEKSRKSTTKAKSIWTETELISEQGTVEVGAMGLNDFGFPKPTALIEKVVRIGSGFQDYICDYFAGAGTTGHAVVNLNREDDGQRNFILVEMGDHFDSVIINRVMKIMYIPDWKKSLPKTDPTFPMNGVYPDWVERSPRLVKVMRLESYEDSLNALELPQEQDARAKGMQDLFGDEYLLKYLLPTEVEDVSEVFLNTEKLEKPFGYRLRIHTPEGVTEQPVDLVETFNLLMGYHVKRIFKLSGEREYTCVEAQTEAGKVLVLWRDIAKLDPGAERAFLGEQIDLSEYGTIYANGDIAVPNGVSLDREFKDRLLARAVGVLA
jgi:adenine-specific DNA-methyltransferase